MTKVTPTNSMNLDPLPLQRRFAALDTIRFIENFVAWCCSCMNS